MRRIYLNEYNIRMERSAYLPIATGLLRAFAERVPEIAAEYEFAPFIYHIDSPASILRQYESPAIAAFSLSMWNEQLNLSIAEEVKRRWPDSLIVFGGPQVPQRPADFFAEHPFVDVAVRAEGEEAFAKVLLRALESRDFSGIANAAWRSPSGECVRNEVEGHQPKDLDMYPSPYLEGLYEPVLEDAARKGLELQAIIETNRGCIAAGITVITLAGEKPIEDVIPGEAVLGWDERENRSVWNKVERSLFTGYKRTLLVRTGAATVRATDDHPFFTEHGWVAAGSLRRGDRVLEASQVARGVGRQTQAAPAMQGMRKAGETVVATDVLVGVRGGGSETVAEGAKENNQAVLQGVRSTNGSTTNEVRTIPLQQDLLRRLRDRVDRSIQSRRQEPDAISGESGEGVRHLEETADRIVRSHEGDVARSPRAHDEGRPRRHEPETFWSRIAAYLFPGTPSFAVPIYRGLQFLDRSVPLRQTQKSGLHHYATRQEARDPGARPALAQRSGAQSSRGRGLPEQGVVRSDHLGRRSDGCVAGEKDTRVRWAEVEEISEAGTNATFDLINATPYPNFFANGMLVHNCPFPCSFCIAEGTMISTSDGPRPIESLRPGDHVIGYDEIARVIVPNVISDVDMTGQRPTIKIKTGTHELEVTIEHKLLTSRGWLEAWQLSVMDELLSYEGARVDWTPISSISISGVRKVYDLVNAHPYPNFFANGLLAHNCYWGMGGLSRKYRFHGVDRVRLELEWIAQHKLRYCFNSDSNFGMHKRDEEIAQILVDIKTKYGFPEKFRTCFGKNADERIYEIARKLHGADLEKGITLALQSNDKTVLRNIQRQNIKLETYKSLQVRFNEANVPVYSELILGLPGETFETWKRGVEEMLSAGLKNQLFIYLCQVFPNTEMAEPEYQRRFGIVTRRIELNEIHGALRTDDLVTEYEDVIVTTDAMPLSMWREMVLFSWLTMVLHSLKIAFFVMLWLSDRHGVKVTDFIERFMHRGRDYGDINRELEEFDGQIERLLSGRGRGRRVEGHAPIYWDEEEASFLRIAEDADGFYDELLSFVRALLEERGRDVDEDELREVMFYQRLRIPTADDEPLRTVRFQRNIPEYFDRLLTSSPIALRTECQTMTVRARRFADKGRFAIETLMWGRKSGTIMTRVEWFGCEEREAA